MASIFKRGTDKGDRMARWYITYTTADGQRRTVKGCPDKQATEAMARKLESEAELRRRGIIDSRADALAAHAAKPLGDHLADWHADLTARGVTAKQAHQNQYRAARVVELAGAERLAELTPSRVQAAIGALRAGGLSLRSIHHYTRAAKGFSRWLWRDGRTREDSLAHLAPPSNPESDRRHERRALTSDEAGKLIRAAASGPVVLRVPGDDRAMLYMLALGSGLRASELASLTPESFDLDGAPPTVTVRAGHSKRRREDCQPIRPDLAEALRPWLASKRAGRPLWPKRHLHNAAHMIRKDLEAAGVPYVTDEGIADFHALRHSFVTALARTNAPVKVVQTLARHSTPMLTLGTYTHLGLHDQSAALEGLPSLTTTEAPQPEAARATGTDGRTHQRRAAPAQRAGCGEGREGSVTVASDDVKTPTLELTSMDRNPLAGEGVRRNESATDGHCRSGGGGIRTHGDVAATTVFKTVPQFAQTSSPLRLAASPPAPRSAGAAPRAETPPDLAAVIDAWPSLPEALRAGILAMVRATGKGVER